MSNNIFTAFIALAATSLAFAAGCAAESDEEEHPSPQLVDEDKVSTDSTGQTCSCPSGDEYQNGLCYPKCNAGFTGVGPVCWSTCASGFTDTGAFCDRNGKIISANTSSCPWYNKCGLGSSCSKCPSGYANDGCTCRIDAYVYAKSSYGRGAGSSATCTTF